jgi:pyruvate/2-oxoglutarate dehydrogenase complex dihydrolipoamide dehydrogenase (E3) component
MKSNTNDFPLVSWLDKETKSPTLLAMAPSMNQKEQSPSPADTQRNAPQNQVKTLSYDFVVLGCGNAGLSAVKSLRETCPSAKIALVDPLRPVASATKKLDYWPHLAVGFDPVSRTVQLSDKSHQLLYRHGILVATGCRGAPPPPSLFDEQTLDHRVLEIRPTESLENLKRPVVPPHTVRQLTLMAASQGATIGVMGSGWEAVELAVAAASAGSKSPIMTFGSAGPLCHILPRYLSVAVTKRLQQQGVDVQRRSLVRYVATDHKDESRLEVHTAMSYDMLDTKRTSVDLLVGK